MGRGDLGLRREGRNPVLGLGLGVTGTFTHAWKRGVTRLDLSLPDVSSPKCALASTVLRKALEDHRLGVRWDLGSSYCWV